MRTILLLLMTCVVAFAQPPIQRTPLTTNQHMVLVPSDGSVPIWNNTANRWSNAPLAALEKWTNEPSRYLQPSANTNIIYSGTNQSGGFYSGKLNIASNSWGAPYNGLNFMQADDARISGSGLEGVVLNFDPSTSKGSYMNWNIIGSTGSLLSASLDLVADALDGGGSVLFSMTARDHPTDQSQDLARLESQMTFGSTNITTRLDANLDTNNPAILLSYSTLVTKPFMVIRTNSSNVFKISNDGNLDFLRRISYSWPTAQGAARTVLTNDGAGVLGWGTDASGTPGGAEASIQVKMGSSFVGSTNTTFDVTNGTLIVGSAVGQTSSNLVVRGTNGFTELIIQPNTHRVGIGTNVPGAPFHVHGPTRFDGNITNSGNLLFSPDNTYNIGESGAVRPQSIFAARDILSAQLFLLGWSGLGGIKGLDNGIFRLQNNNANNFTALVFGIHDSDNGPSIGKTNGHLIVLNGGNGAGLFSGGATNGLLIATGGNKAAKVGGTLIVSNSPIASAGASETNLITATIPAHTLTNSGDRLVIRASGRFAATAENKTVKLILGSETILDTSAQLVNGGAWVIEAEIIRTGNTAQTASAEYHGAGVTLFTTAAAVTLAQTNGIDTTLKVTGTAATDGGVTNRTLTVEWWPTPTVN